MGTARGARFKNMVQLLELNGMNIWEARMKARKILGMKLWERWGSNFPGMRHNYHMNAHHLNADSIPTNEDKLDVDFWSIVSDCKAILSGQLKPRIYSDFSNGWRDEPAPHEMHASNNAKHNMRLARMRVLVKQQLEGIREKKKSYYGIKRGVPVVRIDKMKRLLMANGMNELDAMIQARKLLKVNDEEKTNGRTEIR